MTYIVSWEAEALQQINALQAADPTPPRVREASAFVDYVLRRLPLGVGESRGRGYYLWYGDVLGVFYKVDQAAMTVQVHEVSLARRPR